MRVVLYPDGHYECSDNLGTSLVHFSLRRQIDLDLSASREVLILHFVAG